MTFEDSIAGRGRARGRILVVLTSWRWVGSYCKRLSPQISENLTKLGPYLLAKTRGADHPHSKKFPISNFWHRLLLHASLSVEWGR